MQIDILYSKNNAAHLQAASFVKKAVSNLGISAVINERETEIPSPRVMINGFDLLNGIRKPSGTDVASPIPSYDSIVQALEQTAWSGI